MILDRSHLLLCIFCLAPVISEIGVAAETLDDIVAGKAEELAKDFKFTEGPVWHPDGYLLFSDIPPNRIMKWEPGKGISIFREASGGANGLVLDAQNRLVACEEDARLISRTRADGTTEALAATWEGKRFNSPNDVVMQSNGAIYLTDPTFGLRKRAAEVPAKSVYRIDPKSGEVKRVIENDFTQPNGLAFSPDEKILYVCDSGTAGFINAYDVAADGSLTNKRKLCDVASPDGMKADEKGRLYVASKPGVSVFRSDGSLIGVIPVPQQPANLAFGGKDRKTLYITARTGLYKVEVKTAGIAAGNWRSSPASQ
ncbi:MAG: SMP-30/gluconolactonase/LRE family protein [Candidatus Sumerlaeota bacterium]|nr:SMP-30/gluconolactonase/LRE family protein [Candidatus Sumerlaeota bacterium]